MHEGEIAGGHYWAVAKRLNRWFSFDDSRTTSLGTEFPSGPEPLVYGLLFQQALL
jgi:ubiquitin C-terminal hydrolase